MNKSGKDYNKRIIQLAFFTVILFVILIGRLYWIQIKNYDKLKTEALKQRAEEITLYPNRGIIYDRNLIPLTNVNRKDILLVFKEKMLKNDEIMDIIIKNTYLNYVDLIEYVNLNKDIIVIPSEEKISHVNNNKDIFVTEMTMRYSDDNILSHVIGYINKSENRGETGIEKVYDDILVNLKNKNKLYLDVDEEQNIFLNGEYKVDKEIDILEPNSVKLTIDYHIQKIVENVMDYYGINGAVIVADVKTGDIMALASRPNFDQNNIQEYFERKDMALYNKAIQVGYPPGSLYKIVVLLAAIEENLEYLNKEFYCKGYEQIGEVIIGCSKKEGHGHINTKDAFSQSCNSAFIQLGKEIGSDKIMSMAKKLGFGDRVNIGLLEEIKGNLPEGEEIKGPAIGNISIGQGSIEVTPIQITNLMMIIANNGIKKDLSIVDGITNEDGLMIKPYTRNPEERVISSTASNILKEYLKEVVENGTAKTLDLKDIGGAAGKTGTAQGQLNGKETIYGWFSGFYPINVPKYVITVLVEDGISGTESAVPVFEKIVKEISNINR